MIILKVISREKIYWIIFFVQVLFIMEIHDVTVYPDINFSDRLQ